MKILSQAGAKKKAKRLEGLRFCTIMGRSFKWHHGSDGVKGEARRGRKLARKRPKRELFPSRRPRFVVLSTFINGKDVPFRFEFWLFATHPCWSAPHQLKAEKGWLVKCLKICTHIGLGHDVTDTDYTLTQTAALTVVFWGLSSIDF